MVKAENTRYALKFFGNHLKPRSLTLKTEEVISTFYKMSDHSSSEDCYKVNKDDSTIDNAL